MQNLIIPAADRAAINAQIGSVIGSLDVNVMAQEEIDRFCEALIGTRKDIEQATVINDRPYRADLADYTVVLADEPDCDGQTYSVIIVSAPSAPFAVTLAELQRNEMAVACYFGDVREAAAQQWAPRWNPWVEDDTIGTILDHRNED